MPPARGRLAERTGRAHSLHTHRSASAADTGPLGTCHSQLKGDVLIRQVACDLTDPPPPFLLLLTP